MKIKKVGWTSFLLASDNITVLTDPLLLNELDMLFPKSKADVCLFTNSKKVKNTLIKHNKLQKKIVGDNREQIIEITTPGEYEVSGIMIRRDIGDDFYVIDEKNIRVVYMGGTDNTFDVEKSKDLGDVDVLIIPVGDGINFMGFEQIEKVISNTDPAILIPCAYKGEGDKSSELKSKEEFIKHFGFTNVKEENYVNVNKKRVEEEGKSIEVIFLQ